MIKRQIQPVLQEMFKSFPVVTVTGPRQSGKTTLVKNAFPKAGYISLEDLEARQFAQSDPKAFLSQYPETVIIDEIQHVPSLLSYIQTAVDAGNKTGMFILTGSNQFKYMHSISQSLAGRTGILKLLPFSFQELYSKTEDDLSGILFTGFYPRIFDQNIRPEFFYSGYMETYLERDVRTLLNVKDLLQFHRFIKLCAGRTGQIVNFSSIGNDLGVSNKTIKEWMSILEASFIIFLLKPYYKNYNKRIIKSPKLYFLDVGLAAHLLGVEKKEQIESHPLKGELFESFVVAEFLKHRFNSGLQDNLYFFRDQTGNEVDLIMETGNGPVPVEIKSAKTIAPHFFKGLNEFRKLDAAVPHSFLITGDTKKQKRTGYSVFGYNHIPDVFSELNP